MPDILRWDELQEGDILVLPTSHGDVPIKLLPTCVVHNSPEVWNQVCVCGSPSCSGTFLSINVRQCFANNPGLIKIRRGEWVYRNPGKADA